MSLSEDNKIKRLREIHHHNGVAERRCTECGKNTDTSLCSYKYEHHLCVDCILVHNRMHQLMGEHTQNDSTEEEFELQYDEEWVSLSKLKENGQ